MPVDKKNKIVFIHVPKNGGTAISNSLEMEHPGHKFWNNRIYVDYYNQGYKSIAITRDTFDRIVSNYEYSKLETSFWHSSISKSIFGKHLDYDLCKKYSLQEVIFKNFISKEIKLKHEGWDHQHIYFCNKDTKIMIDNLILYENMNEWFLNEFKVVIKEINVSKKEKFNKDKFLNSFGKECTDIIENIYYKDIDLYWRCRNEK